MDSTALEMFQLAHLILSDTCPPERNMYLCSMQEDVCGDECTLCWSNYLLFVLNGRKRDPYVFDRSRYEREVV